MVDDTNAVLQHWRRQQDSAYAMLRGMDEDEDGGDDDALPELPGITLEAVEELNAAIAAGEPVCHGYWLHDLAFLNLATARELTAPDDVLVGCGQTWWDAQQVRDASAGVQELGVRRWLGAIDIQDQATVRYLMCIRLADDESPVESRHLEAIRHYEEAATFATEIATRDADLGRRCLAAATMGAGMALTSAGDHRSGLERL